MGAILIRNMQQQRNGLKRIISVIKSLNKHNPHQLHVIIVLLICPRYIVYNPLPFLRPLIIYSLAGFRPTLTAAKLITFVVCTSHVQYTKHSVSRDQANIFETSLAIPLLTLRILFRRTIY